MQELFETFNFDELPLEIQENILSYADTPALAGISTASNQHRTLFKPLLDVRKLLHYVVHSDHDAVQKLLKENIDLLFIRGRVSDCSGRVFDHISGFEYALWALDKHMWAAMLECIPHTEEGEKVLEKLRTQYAKLTTEGITYILHGQAICEKHFDFKNTILNELQTQLDLIGELEPLALQEGLAHLGRLWRQRVGGAQKLLPMHVVQEYCSKIPFQPVPTFADRPPNSQKFYNLLTQKLENWFAKDSGLGRDFAIFKTTADAKGNNEPLGVMLTLNAVRALYQTRANDFIALASQLKEMAFMSQTQLQMG